MLHRSGSLRRALLGVVVVGALGWGGAAPASAAWHFELGIGDQQTSMFSDPRFAAIGFQHVRVVTPYDVACRPGLQTAYLDAWLAAADHAGVRPLVGFAGSWRPTGRWRLPSYRRFLRCFKAFRAHYPDVLDFNPWNEANHSSQPTFRHPKRAAGYYNAIRRACRRCNVAAGDLLDWHNIERWLERYRPHLRGRVRLWSMHNYVDVNRRPSWRRSKTRWLLRHTRGKLWITETAGVVFSRRSSGFDEESAADATHRMFAIANRSRRITRLYTYQWQASCDPDTWDSGWFRSDGSPRPAYHVFVDELARARGLDSDAVAALDPPLGPATHDTCADGD
jgi:hypothetical protein